MNFEDEPYVRLYVRDTKTWLRLEFEGQCVLMFLLRKLDKAGVLDGMDELVSDVALVTRVPEAIVAVGLPRLLKWGVFQLVGNRLIMPNYLQAQNAIRTDKARQRDMREKRLAQARLVTPRDADVTLRDETSREPTPDDASSRDVTLYCTDLYSAEPEGERARPHVATTGPEPEPDTPEPVAPVEGPVVVTPIRRLAYFVPDDWQPNDLHRMRCAELRFALGDLVSRFRKTEFQRAYSDWNRRFELWLEDERIKRETAVALPPARASPHGRGSHNPKASKQPNAGLTGFESLAKERP